MDDTYDEFSEVAAAQVVLPPMASMSLEMAHAAVLDDNAENLDLGASSDSEDNDGDDAAVEAIAGVDPAHGNHRGETERVARAESDDDEAADDMGFGEGEDLEVADVDGSDAEGGNEDEAPQGEAPEDDLVNDNPEPALRLPTSTSDHTPPFALSRLKSLFSFVEQTSRSSSEYSTLPTCVLSTEGAYALSEAVKLMLTDLVRAASDETQRRGKKTVTFDDVAFVGANLDRFAFVRDLLPMPTATLKGTIESRAQHQPVRSAVTAASGGAEAKQRRARVGKKSGTAAAQGREQERGGPTSIPASRAGNEAEAAGAETTAPLPKQRQTTLTSYFAGR